MSVVVFTPPPTNMSIVHLFKRIDKSKRPLDWQEVVDCARGNPRELRRVLHHVLRRRPNATVLSELLDIIRTQKITTSDHHQEQHSPLLRTYPHQISSFFFKLKPVAIAAHSGCHANVIRCLMKATVAEYQEATEEGALFDDTEFQRLPLEALQVMLEVYPQGALECPVDSGMGTFSSRFLAFALCQQRPCDLWPRLKIVLRATHYRQAPASPVHGLLDLVGGVGPCKGSDLDVLGFKSLEEAIQSVLEECAVMEDDSVFHTCDDNGRYPLHVLCQNHFARLRKLGGGTEEPRSATVGAQQQRPYSYELLKFILDMNPKAARKATARGQLPLHLALHRRFPRACWKDLLLKEYPDAVNISDTNCGFYPYQIAAEQDLSLTEIYELLRVSPEPGVKHERSGRSYIDSSNPCSLMDSPMYKKLACNELLISELVRQNHLLRKQLEREGLLSSSVQREYQYYVIARQEDPSPTGREI